MCISYFSNCELITLASTLAITISKEFSRKEIIILAAFFTALGDILALLSLDK